jgi:hypothetical protein
VIRNPREIRLIPAALAGMGMCSRGGVLRKNQGLTRQPHSLALITCSRGWALDRIRDYASAALAGMMPRLKNNKAIPRGTRMIYISLTVVALWLLTLAIRGATQVVLFVKRRRRR